MGIVEMFRMMWMMISALFMIIQQLVVNHTTPTTITGPVGIYKITAEASSMGFVYLLQIMSILSINLAIINYLPLPALDGGRVLFIASEKLFGRKISAQTENIIHIIGFVAIISILIIVTIGDVQRYF
jgi:regulator of sigma E protease